MSDLHKNVQKMLLDLKAKIVVAESKANEVRCSSYTSLFGLTYSKITNVNNLLTAAMIELEALQKNVDRSYNRGAKRAKKQRTTA